MRFPKLSARLSLSGALLIVCLVLASRDLSTITESAISQIDLVQYWAASRAVHAGGDPYESGSLFLIERQADGIGESLSEVIRMWNPPLVLPFIGWMRHFDFIHVRLIWGTLSVLSIAGCIFLLTRRSRYEWNFPAAVALLSFFPMYSTLRFGQISWILLLGVAGSLIWQNRPFIAGTSLSLIFLKPHVLILYFAHRATQRSLSEGVKFVCGGLAGTTFLGLTAYSCAPEMWGQWIASLREAPPHYFQTPTIGSFLQGEFGEPLFRYLPLTILTALVCTASFLKLRFMQDPLLTIPVALLASPYGWVFDQIVLLPLILRISAHSRKRWAWCLVAAHSVAFTPFLTAQHHFVWYPMVVLGLYLLANKEGGSFQRVSGTSSLTCN